MIDTRTQEAVTLSIVNSGCLWWWTWMQFLTALYYGLPLVSYNPADSLWLYVTPEGWPTNLPRMFLTVTIVAVLTLFSGAPIILAGSKAKIRQLILLVVFSSIAVWFSFVMVRSEAMQYEAATKQLEWYRGDDLPWWAEDGKDWWIPALEKVIVAYEDSKL